MNGKVTGACCTDAGLGVPTSSLRLFELREVAPGAELSEGTQRIAAALPDSSALRQSAMMLPTSNAMLVCELRALRHQPDALRPDPGACLVCRLVTGRNRGHHV